MKQLVATLAGALVLALAGQALAGSPAAGGGVTSGLGCGAQCITKAKVIAGPFNATLQVRTDTPARISVKVSDQEPFHATGGPHFYVWDAAASTGGAYKTAWNTSLSGLEPGTLYHIVVWATDGEGRTAYREGTFETPGRHVVLTFWKVKVLNDADHDCCISANKGELSFDYYANGGYVHGNGQKKLASGASFHPHPAEFPIPIDDAPRYLELFVGGSECDHAGWNCVFEADDYCGSDSDCAEAHATLDLDDLGGGALPGNYGTDMPSGHDGYVVFETPHHYYLEFRVYAYVDVYYG
jgi:hypothetical protein